MTRQWRVAFRGVFPDMQPDPTPGIAFDQWFDDDEAAARQAFETFEGSAVLYTVVRGMRDLGRTIVARKNQGSKELNDG
jgi:hypothetical protein